MNPLRKRGTPRAGELHEAIGHVLNRAIRNDASPGLIGAIVDRRGVRGIAAAGVRKSGHAQPLLGTDLVHIGSNTKAMTATMLAVLVQDGVFGSGWSTSIAEVFPELRDDIHPDYHAVTLWHLVTMTGGIERDAADWHAHGDARLIERRYGILRDNLANPPAATVGKHLYSNLGYVVAGAMAERVTLRTWESLMQERLFAPLGISSAGFGAPGSSRRALSRGARGVYPSHGRALSRGARGVYPSQERTGCALGAPARRGQRQLGTLPA